MPKIFISHSHKNKKDSIILAEWLKKDKFEIWIDREQMVGGESLSRKISFGLDWCDTLLLLWSKSASNSRYVNMEWECALALEKDIIPCLLDDEKLPALLSRYLYIDLKTIENGYRDLVHSLKRIGKTTHEYPKTIRKKGNTFVTDDFISDLVFKAVDNSFIAHLFVYEKRKSKIEGNWYKGKMIAYRNFEKGEEPHTAHIHNILKKMAKSPEYREIYKSKYS